MSRLIAFFLMVATALNPLSAASLAYCDGATRDPAQAVAVVSGSHAHHSHAVSHTAAMTADDAGQSFAGVARLDSDARPDHCHVSSAFASLPTSVVIVHLFAARDVPLSLVDAMPVSAVPGRLERPPSAFLA